MPRHPAVTGIVLAGGGATRLGGLNKAMLRVAGAGTEVGDRGEATILSRILGLFHGRFDSAVLVLGRDQPAWELPQAGIDLAIARDRIAGAGPLAGIEAGLSAIGTELGFVCAADMPFLSGELIDLMAGAAHRGRALVPMKEGRPEPLHAIYPRECLPSVTAALESGERTIRALLDRIAVDWLDERAWGRVPGAASSFENLNTPEDLERAERRRRGGGD